MAGEGLAGEGVAAGRYGAGARAPGSTSAPGNKQRLHAGTQLSLFSLGPQPREWNGATTLPAPPSNPHRQAPVRAPPVTLNTSMTKHRLKSAKAKAFTQGRVCLQSLGTGPLPVTFYTAFGSRRLHPASVSQFYRVGGVSHVCIPPLSDDFSSLAAFLHGCYQAGDVASLADLGYTRSERPTLYTSVPPGCLVYA